MTTSAPRCIVAPMPAVTTRKLDRMFTETERVRTDDEGRPLEVVRTICACEAPSATRKGCATVTGNRTPCRCDCHREV